MKRSVIVLGLVACSALGATPKWELDGQCTRVEIEYLNAKLTVTRDKMDGGFYPEFTRKDLPVPVKDQVLTVNGISSLWLGNASNTFSPEHELASVIVISDLFKERPVTVEYGNFSLAFSGDGFRKVFKQFIKYSEVPNGTVAQ